MKQSAGTTWQRVAKLAELSPERPRAAHVDGVELVLVQSADGVRAYDAVCPHRGTLLSEGEIVDGKLVCRGHGWRFDLVTGERAGGVPQVCLRAHQVVLNVDHAGFGRLFAPARVEPLDDAPQRGEETA